MTSDDFIELGDRTLRSRRLTPQRNDGLERTTLIFLHEGLGCIEMWRDFPQRLCDATMCAGVVYDRTAYGRSSPWPSDPGVRYMEIEADIVLPRLLAALGIDHEQVRLHCQRIERSRGVRLEPLLLAYWILVGNVDGILVARAAFAGAACARRCALRGRATRAHPARRSVAGVDRP